MIILLKFKKSTSLMISEARPGFEVTLLLPRARSASLSDLYRKFSLAGVVHGFSRYRGHLRNKVLVGNESNGVGFWRFLDVLALRLYSRAVLAADDGGWTIRASDSPARTLYHVGDVAFQRPSLETRHVLMARAVLHFVLGTRV